MHSVNDAERKPTMSNYKIKKCPHCGGESYLNSRYSVRCKGHMIFVRCEICGAQGKIYKAQADPETNGWNGAECLDAVNAWNMRTTEPERSITK